MQERGAPRGWAPTSPSLSAHGPQRMERLGCSHGLSAAESCGDLVLGETDFLETEMGLIAVFSFYLEVSSFKECVWLKRAWRKTSEMSLVPKDSI